MRPAPPQLRFGADARPEPLPCDMHDLNYNIYYTILYAIWIMHTLLGTVARPRGRPEGEQRQRTLRADFLGTRFGSEGIVHLGAKTRSNS